MSRAVDPATATGCTVGVEEEFLCIDSTSARTVARAPAVLAAAATCPSPAPDAAVGPELLTTQVEAVTGRCTSMHALREQLVGGRRRLGVAAAAHHVRLISCATPVLAAEAPAVSAGERFRRIADKYAGVVADYQACGCHVHVGVPDRDTAVAVVNHLRPWLPTLLALSGNSALHHGQDTGHESWRMVQQSRFPGSGLPPWCASAADHDKQIARLVDCGVLVDEEMSFWLLRPSPRWPTVEFRVADAAPTVAEAVLQAALSRALVRTALADLARGREAPDIDAQVASAAVWSAARHGLHGSGVHPAQERRVPALHLLRALLSWVGPALEEFGDRELVGQTIATVLGDGTGAERQRRAATSGPRAAADMLAAATVPSAVPAGACQA